MLGIRDECIMVGDVIRTSGIAVRCVDDEKNTELSTIVIVPTRWGTIAHRCDEKLQVPSLKNYCEINRRPKNCFISGINS